MSSCEILGKAKGKDPRTSTELGGDERTASSTELGDVEFECEELVATLGKPSFVAAWFARLPKSFLFSLGTGASCPITGADFGRPGGGIQAILGEVLA